MLYERVILRQRARETVLFLGASPVARMVAEGLAENPDFGLGVTGFLEDSPASSELSAGSLLGPIGLLRTVVETRKPHRIVVGMTESGVPIHDLLDLRSSGIHIEEARTAYEDVFRRVSVEDLRRSQLIFSPALAPRSRAEFLHNSYSYVLAVAAFLIASPLLLLAALAARVTSPGPVLRRQIRSGKHGAPFTLYTFRAGWLRRLRLDRLARLINLVRGDMVIVGPHPEHPEFVAALAAQIPYYRQRLAVKPGITGWAQVNDNSADALLKLEYDLYYIKNLNMTLDVYILFQTAKLKLLPRGAL